MNNAGVKPCQTFRLYVGGGPPTTCLAAAASSGPTDAPGATPTTKQIATSTNARLLGRQVEVLVEGEHKGKWRGRTPGNKLVFFADSANWIGRLAPVVITQTGPWSLQGRLVEKEPPS